MSRSLEYLSIAERVMFYASSCISSDMSASLIIGFLLLGPAASFDISMFLAEEEELYHVSSEGMIIYFERNDSK